MVVVVVVVGWGRGEERVESRGGDVRGNGGWGGGDGGDNGGGGGVGNDGNKISGGGGGGGGGFHDHGRECGMVYDHARR